MLIRMAVMMKQSDVNNTNMVSTQGSATVMST